MTKSRKLLLAGVLLAGGYGIACLSGGAPNPVSLRTGRLSGTSEAEGLLSTLRNLGRDSDDSVCLGELVPESGRVRGLTGTADALVPQQVPPQPTWLAATSEDHRTLPVVEPSKLIEQPAPADSLPIASAQPADLSAAAVETAPIPLKATITNVVASSVPAAAASPWDRWPWWDVDARPANTSVTISPASQMLAPSAPAAMTASYTAADSVRPIPSSFEAVSPLDRAGGRTHVIVDGDSLAKLADRYLDDESLADEIYRLNRGLLNDPELLPIGAEIRIPEPRVAESPQLLAGTAGLATSTSGPPAGMVPVEWRPRPFDSEPRAQLLRPVPPGRGN